MAFDNASNAGRVERIVGALALIQRSAESNRATVDEVTALMAPIIRHLRDLGVLDNVDHPAPSARPGQATSASPPGSLRSRIDGLHALALADLMGIIASDLGQIIHDEIGKGEG